MVGSAANCHQLQRHCTKKESANQRHTTFFLFFLLCLFVVFVVVSMAQGVLGRVGHALELAAYRVLASRFATAAILLSLFALLWGCFQAGPCVFVCVCVFACVVVISLSCPPPWSAPCLAEKQQSLFHSDLLFIQESMPFFSAETHIITGSATAAAC